jgi:hypothetical protein
MATTNRRGLVGVEVDASKILAKLAPSLYRRAVSDFVAAMTLTAERASKGAVPVDMGGLRRSITSEIQPLSGRVFTPLAYAAAVDQGRRPGSTPPPPQALVGWMARHGMTGSPWVLARAIGRRGTKGRFFMRAGLEAAQTAAPKLLFVTARRIESAWGS